jgi:chromosome segregation ATPase
MLGLERDRFTLKTAVEVDRVHLDILRSRVADAAAQAAKPAPPDPVAEGLKKIVAARRAALEELRAAVRSSLAPHADLNKADAELTEAEIRLALRKEETAKAQGDGEKERLNRQLRELSAQLMLDEVRLRELDNRLHMLQNALDLVDDYNDVTGRIASIDREIEQGNARRLRAALGLPHDQ